MSRAILKLRNERKLNYTSYAFYVNDLIVFCREEMRGVQNLMELMDSYAKTSGQYVSNKKNNVLFATNISRRQALIDFLEIHK